MTESTARSAASARDRIVATTFQPSRAKRRAAAWPMPLDVPVSGIVLGILSRSIHGGAIENRLVQRELAASSTMLRMIAVAVSGS
jgi:hypothetical protein